MKFRIERTTFADGVAWAAKALAARPQVPVLAGILIEASGDQVTFTAYDYETAHRITLAATVEVPGTAVVSGRLLADIAQALPDRPVDMMEDHGRLRVACGSYKTTLLTMPVDEYPSRPAFPTGGGTVHAAEFARAVARVAVAASRDETLPLLTSVKMETVFDRIIFTATDRYRCAICIIPWGPGGSQDGVTLLRSSTLAAVAKTLTGSQDVTIAVGGEARDQIAGFRAGPRQVTSLLVDGDYPKVANIFPDDPPVRAVISTTALTEAVKRVALVAERSTPVRLEFVGGTLRLTAGAGDDAQAEESLPCELDGDNLSTAFNPHFLLDGLAALGAPVARLSFTLATKPAVLTGQQEIGGDDDMSYRYLLMPVRLAG